MADLSNIRQNLIYTFGRTAYYRIKRKERVLTESEQKELAQSIGITLDGIKYHIKNMTKQGLIKHEGSTKAEK